MRVHDMWARAVNLGRRKTVHTRTRRPSGSQSQARRKRSGPGGRSEKEGAHTHTKAFRVPDQPARAPATLEHSSHRHQPTRSRTSERGHAQSRRLRANTHANALAGPAARDMYARTRVSV